MVFIFTPNYTIEEKRVIVEDWMASGIIMKEFCRIKENNTSTFDEWLNRFYPDIEKKTKKRSTAMVKIQAAGLDDEFLMEYRDTRIRFNKASLRNVLQALDAVNG